MKDVTTNIAKNDFLIGNALKSSNLSLYVRGGDGSCRDDVSTVISGKQIGSSSVTCAVTIPYTTCILDFLG